MTALTQADERKIEQEGLPMFCEACGAKIVYAKTYCAKEFDPRTGKRIWWFVVEGMCPSASRPSGLQRFLGQRSKHTYSDGSFTGMYGDGYRLRFKECAE